MATMPGRIHIQLISSFWPCVLQYRQAYTGNNPAQVQTAMDGFEDVIRRFPKCAEGYALYAQVWNQRLGFSWLLNTHLFCPLYKMSVVKLFIQTRKQHFRPCWHVQCALMTCLFCVLFRLWLISSSLEKQTRCMTSVSNWNQTMLPHMFIRGLHLFPLHVMVHSLFRWFMWTGHVGNCLMYF